MARPKGSKNQSKQSVKESKYKKLMAVFMHELEAFLTEKGSELCKKIDALDRKNSKSTTQQ